MALTTKYSTYTVTLPSCCLPELTSSLSCSASCFTDSLAGEFSRGISAAAISCVIYCVPSGRTAKVIPQHVRVCACNRGNLTVAANILRRFYCDGRGSTYGLVSFDYLASAVTDFKLVHGNQKYNYWGKYVFPCTNISNAANTITVGAPPCVQTAASTCSYNFGTNDIYAIGLGATQCSQYSDEFNFFGTPPTGYIPSWNIISGNPITGRGRWDNIGEHQYFMMGPGESIALNYSYCGTVSTSWSLVIGADVRCGCAPCYATATITIPSTRNEGFIELSYIIIEEAAE